MIRFFDIFFSLIALIFLSPLLLPVTILLRFTGEGEIFFLQDRIGYKGRMFKLYKFATMVKDSPNIGTGTVTMKDDPRVLPAGKFLRKSKINELPQLLNILFGDMSLIGPRPLTSKTFSSYKINTQHLVTQVRPGLSGIGSIIFRAEEEIMHGKSASIDFYDATIAPYKGSLEEWFVLNNGINLYFLSIIVTVVSVINPSSAFAWRVFKDLPEPPSELKTPLNFPDK